MSAFGIPDDDAQLDSEEPTFQNLKQQAEYDSSVAFLRQSIPESEQQKLGDTTLAIGATIITFLKNQGMRVWVADRRQLTLVIRSTGIGRVCGNKASGMDIELGFRVRRVYTSSGDCYRWELFGSLSGGAEVAEFEIECGNLNVLSDSYDATSERAVIEALDGVAETMTQYNGMLSHPKMGEMLMEYCCLYGSKKLTGHEFRTSMQAFQQTNMVMTERELLAYGIMSLTNAPNRRQWLQAKVKFSRFWHAVMACFAFAIEELNRAHADSSHKGVGVSVIHGVGGETPLIKDTPFALVEQGVGHAAFTVKRSYSSGWGDDVEEEVVIGIHFPQLREGGANDKVVLGEIQLSYFEPTTRLTHVHCVKEWLTSTELAAGNQVRLGAPFKQGAIDISRCATADGFDRRETHGPTGEECMDFARDGVCALAKVIPASVSEMIQVSSEFFLRLLDANGAVLPVVAAIVARIDHPMLREHHKYVHVRATKVEEGRVTLQYTGVSEWGFHCKAAFRESKGMQVGLRAGEAPNVGYACLRDGALVKGSAAERAALQEYRIACPHDLDSRAVDFYALGTYDVNMLDVIHACQEKAIARLVGSTFRLPQGGTAFSIVENEMLVEKRKLELADLPTLTTPGGPTKGCTSSADDMEDEKQDELPTQAADVEMMKEEESPEANPLFKGASSSRTNNCSPSCGGEPSSKKMTGTEVAVSNPAGADEQVTIVEGFVLESPIFKSFGGEGWPFDFMTNHAQQVEARKTAVAEALVAYMKWANAKTRRDARATLLKTECVLTFLLLVFGAKESSCWHEKRSELFWMAGNNRPISVQEFLVNAMPERREQFLINGTLGGGKNDCPGISNIQSAFKKRTAPHARKLRDVIRRIRSTKSFSEMH